MTEETNVLFVRGNGNKSNEEDIWDDTALIEAYDKAVNLAKEEVAKRIAMATLSEQHTKVQSFKNLDDTKKSKKWHIGSPCRAVYSVDGEVYEAIISKIFENSGTCLVKFIGYQNVEKVALGSLLESEGLQSQIAQQKMALAEKEDEDSETHFGQNTTTQANSERMDTEDSKPSRNHFTFESGYFNPLNAMPPAPPLPPQLMAKLPQTDGDALSSMLMSWYMSGFHTGYYHGMKQANINRQKKRNH